MKNNEDKPEKELTEKQYKILREKETEAPFTGKYLNEKSRGIYNCAFCGAKLFDSETKFDSSTGWPSFDEAITGATKEIPDNSHGMNRIEIICTNCHSHLGHKFDDGTTDKKTRYCINSACLNLKKSDN